ncbi:MAG: FAD-dependent oxidoreductase [Armatimonadetes bacterium]|nr:FAD-dependent oxidoreductase [Armatimonadota bacterium]
MRTLMLGLACSLLALGAIALAQDLPKPDASTLYLEAERFADTGGWTVDAQFRQIMGSTYLIAVGTGVPVADATTSVSVPKAGTYRLWVRCKDWHEASPGRFQVLTNGRASATTFGEQKRDWSWIDGGAFELPAGETTLALHDLTGYYGRCDALLLTTDGAFTPPDDVTVLAKLRDAILGVPEAKTLGFDFVVVGGGYGGVCAAVQAARLGLKTALIQNRPVLGGNASSEINVGPGGASPHTSRFRETGICEEIAEGRVRPGAKNWSDGIDLVVQDQPNLTVFLNTEGMRAVMDGKHIAAVEAEHVITGEKTTFRAPLFADCTGDGVIAFSAGCEFRHGEEARSEYNESLAPEQATPYTMGTSLLHSTRKMDAPQPYTPPPFAVKFGPEHFTKRKDSLFGGQWWIEYGGMLDTIQDAETIRDELIRVIYGAWDWVKNQNPDTMEQATNYTLAWVPTVGGKRESRRFLGDYVLKQNDVDNAVVFPDRVAWGGWPIDIHPSPGIYGKDIPPANFHQLKTYYSIPYRCLYTRDVDNLFLAGRHISVTHVALGSVRLMQTIGTEGQAVGAAAYLCQKHGVLPPGVNPAHITELQQLLLRHDAFIPEVRNEDPLDLCRGARITASSVGPNVIVRTLSRDPAMTRDAPCTMDRGQNYITEQPNLTKLSLYLQNTTEQPTQAKLHIEKGDVTGTVQVSAPAGAGAETQGLSPVGGGGLPPEMEAKAVVQPGKPSWVDFVLPQALTPNQTHFIWVEKNPALLWRICENAEGQRTWRTPQGWTITEGLYALKPYTSFRSLGNVNPESALNGLKWPLAGEGNLWRSDPAQGLPAWLQIDFGKPVTVNTVYLTFDTNIYGRFPVGTPGTEALAEDYRVSYHRGDNVWEVLINETGNWRRFRRHQFPTVTTDKLRLEVLKAKNGNEARVYEVRAYEE